MMSNLCLTSIQRTVSSLGMLTSPGGRANPNSGAFSPPPQAVSPTKAEMKTLSLLALVSLLSPDVALQHSLVSEPQIWFLSLFDLELRRGMVLGFTLSGSMSQV